MVKKLFSLFHISVEGIHKTAFTLAFLAIVAQVLGLVRDRIFAHTFGAGQVLDIYYSAFRIPDFLFTTIASLVSLFVLIPFLTKKLEESKREARVFLSDITTGFIVCMVLLSTVLFIGMPYLVHILFPGFVDVSVQKELVLLSRIMLLSPILLGVSNIFASVTQIYKRFLLYGMSPVLYNIGIIIGVLLFYPLFGIAGLAWGVVLGALLHFLISVPFLFKNALFPQFSLHFRTVWNVIKTSFPRTLALSVSQISLFVLVSLASLMPEGSVSVFSFALNIQNAPLGIIGMSYSVAAFPTLSKLFQEGKTDVFKDHITEAVRHIIFWSVPLIALFVVLRAQIVRVILGTGEFDWTDTRLTAAVLAIFVFSLVAQGLILLLARGYYAIGRTARPLLVNSISSASVILLAVLGIRYTDTFSHVSVFVAKLFRVQDVGGIEVLILPIAFSIGSLVNVCILWFYYRADFGGHFPKSVYTTLWQSIIAGMFVGWFSYWGLQLFESLFNQATIIGVFLHGFLAGILGIGAGFIILRLLKNRELEEVVGNVYK